MKTTEMLELLQEFYRDKWTIRQRHAAAAQHVGHYDFNNTYQYVIAREEGHLRWVRNSIVDLGGTAPDDFSALSAPSDGKGAERERSVIDDDARQQQAFIDRWTPRVDAIRHVRHGNLLGVILGEMREHKRFFDLALEGRDDLLGRRPPGASTGDGVLPVRWVE